MEACTVKIDLNKVVSKDTVKFLSGKNRGLAARNVFSLDDLPENVCHFSIIIPDYISGVSSSFTNGLLGGLVDRSGGLNEFLKIAEFDGKLFVVTGILKALERGYGKEPSFE